MPATDLAPPQEPRVDSLLLAQRCQAVARARFQLSSCIETSLVFERAAVLLGLPVSRVVCQVVAYSPKLAQQMKVDAVDRASIGQPGIWAVSAGGPSKPGDYVGRLDVPNNRFVGHVVCIAEDHLIDPTVGQLSRPEWEMRLPPVVILRLTEAMQAAQVAWRETPEGVLLKYVLHRDVKVPTGKWGKVVERMALGIAREFGARI